MPLEIMPTFIHERQLSARSLQMKSLHRSAAYLHFVAMLERVVTHTWVVVM